MLSSRLPPRNVTFLATLRVVAEVGVCVSARRARSVRSNIGATAAQVYPRGVLALRYRQILTIVWVDVLIFATISETDIKNRVYPSSSPFSAARPPLGQLEAISADLNAFLPTSSLGTPHWHFDYWAHLDRTHPVSSNVPGPQHTTSPLSRFGLTSSWGGRHRVVRATCSMPPLGC